MVILRSPNLVMEPMDNQPAPKPKVGDGELVAAGYDVPDPVKVGAPTLDDLRAINEKIEEGITNARDNPHEHAIESHQAYAQLSESGPGLSARTDLKPAPYAANELRKVEPITVYGPDLNGDDVAADAE